MRKVFANSMVAHVWAQQTQPEGRSANGNLYFNGGVIFSYGSHFPIARFCSERIGDRQVVLISNQSYSVSTSRHQTYVRRALHGLPVVEIYCRQVGAFIHHPDNVRDIVSSFETHAAACARPRKRMWWGWNAATGACSLDTCEARVASIQTPDNLDRYCAAFGLAVPDLALETKRQAIRDAFAKHNDPKTVAKRLKGANKRMLKFTEVMSSYHAWLEGVVSNPPAIDSLPKRERRDAEYRLREFTRSKLVGITPEAWQAGKGDMAALNHSWGTPTLVRRVQSGGRDRLETSRGAEVPFCHAVAVFMRAQACRSQSKAWHRNGEQIQVGHFNLDSVDTEGNIKAGCHTIAWSEMLRLALLEVPHVVKATFPTPALVAA